MWIIALLLLGAAGAGSAVVLTGPQDDVTLDFFGLESVGVPPSSVFAAGAGVATMLWLAMVLLRASITRSTTSRREHQEHEEEVERLEQERAALAEENARLESELDHERRRVTAPPEPDEPHLTGYVQGHQHEGDPRLMR